MVSQEHHGFLAQLVGKIDHFLCQRGHLPALESREVQELLRGNPILVVIVPLVNDEFRPEFVTGLPFELLQNIGGDGGGVAVPVHIFLPFQLVEDQGELVEEGGVADHVHIWMVLDEFPQPLHGKFPGFGLANVEGDLVLKVLPVVGNGVVHVDRVPDEIGQKADGVVMEGLRRGNDHRAAFGLVVPLLRSQRLSRCAVHDLPPALYVVPVVDL